MKRAVVAAFVLLCAFSAHAANTLRVVNAGPVGEISTLQEANEIRVTFSEPMVVVGRVPKEVKAPWFKITPAIKGQFRWAGTTMLIFTPDRRTPLPYGTKYDVTIDASAVSVSNNRLDKPYQWSFTTPTVKLLSTSWYRKGDRINGALVIGMRFNQPVDPAAVLPHFQARTSARDFERPDMPVNGIDRIRRKEPAAVQAFETKRAGAAQAAASNGAAVFSFLATDWDKKREGWSPAKDFVVIETKPGIPVGSAVKISLDADLAASDTGLKSGRVQDYTIELEPALFVKNLECYQNCDPESRNAITFTTDVDFDSLVKSVTVTDITDAAHEIVLKREDRERDYDYPSSEYGLDELGYSIVPAHKYAVRVAPELLSESGEKLGYAWIGTIDYLHRSAFISFGDGQGVWESTGGPLLPFYARNFKSVKQWLAPLKTEELVPTILALQQNGFKGTPPDSTSVMRKLAPVADKTQSYGLDVTPATGSAQKGIVWASVEPGETIARSNVYDPAVRSTIVQVTNLGISAKDSPQNALIFVTRLDDGKPVAGANVSIRTAKNDVFWSGTTDANGLAIAPKTDLRRAKKVAEKKDANAEEQDQDEDWWRALSDFHFVIVAEKDGDTAYVGSDWNEGVSPWEFGSNFNLTESDPLLRGTVFTDRGVYKLGEEVHLKLVLRSDTPGGMQLLPAGTKAKVVIRDSQENDVETHSVDLNAWSSGEFAWKVPADGPLGQYTIWVGAEGQRLRIYGDFLVAAYRRPDFRVDVTLGADSTLAGTKLDAKTGARYLYGGAMPTRPVSWGYSKRPLFDVPGKITDRWPAEQFTFLGWNDSLTSGWSTISTEDTKLSAKGELAKKMDTDLAAGWPYEYRFESEVEDVSRQKIANRATFRVDPAPYYVGVKTPPYFAEAKTGLDTEILVAGLDGLAVPGVEVTVELTRIQWVSTREAEGNGFYTWNSERKEIPAGSFKVTSGAAPVPLAVPLKDGGEYVLTASAGANNDRHTYTRVNFYALGEGYTAWERYDHNRIDLVPEKQTYKPGDTARIMVKSPWENATALLTTEREGVRTWKQFDLKSTQETITVPITANDIPNVYVSVLLVKGRTKEEVAEDGSDPGKPTFRLGYTMLKVEDASKRLKVDVKADRDEFRPATKAKIEVNVKDVTGKPSQSEVTLWAVDYGVLSLTGYQTPDVLDSIYLEKALQVVNEDSRQRIVSRRVLTPKGAGEGGGGGKDGGPGMLRKDFRVLAFWLGSIVTDAKGRAKTEITLPESLTTYRIMAVAGDKASRFGWAQNEIRINKPLMITPAFPRFMALGDKAYFGGVIHNQVKRTGSVTVSIKSLDPGIVSFGGATETKLDIKPGESNEVRFDATANGIGNARVQMRVSGLGENDGFEEVIPVRIFVTPETFAAYGETKSQAKEMLELPAGVVPDFGGLHFEISSTALTGLSEGARYLVTYPYGCAEQRSSAALALMLAGDLGEAFSLADVDAKNLKQISQDTIVELKAYQCGSGGFAFWKGECRSVSPYLTAWVLHVLQRGKMLGYKADDDMLNRGYSYLETALGEKKPANEGWWPAYTAWQAFATKVLAEGGRNVDSHITRLYGYTDRMPLFGIAHLADAMVARGEKGDRLNKLRNKMTNAILPEAGFAHVEELNDPYLLWFWNSNVRSTAMVLDTLVRIGQDEDLVKKLARWLLRVRKGGRWGNTQENAWAMAALVDYYRKYEAEVPDFNAVVTVGTETLVRSTFKGRTADTKVTDVPMRQALAKGPAAGQVPVTFDRQGAAGTLYYLMRLRYAVTGNLDPMDQGFAVERSYRVQGSKDAKTSFQAGDLIEVTITLKNTKERRYVAVDDPVPAGTEPVETWFATTASAMSDAGGNEADDGSYDWTEWWRRGGFDHIERHDDRVHLFATRLSEGTHRYTYLVRATTAGTFSAAPAHAEEMYEPEVFGRTGSTVVEVKR